MRELTADLPVFELLPDDSQYDLVYEFAGDTKDRDGREYVMVNTFLENDDFYQGLNMVTVIRRVSDDKLFGYSWWDDISKHGEPYIEANGDEFGLECDTDASGFDWNTDYISYYVFEPVEEYSIPAYRFMS